MAILPFNDLTPNIGASAWIASDAWVIGDTEIGKKVSIFFGAVLRGDINPIKVGDGSNIQEHALLHTSHGRGPVIVGENVTLGHRAIIHGAQVGARTIVGMGSTILDDAVIGSDSIVGANSLVTSGSNFPPGVLILGSPAKVVRELSPKEIAACLDSALGYQELGLKYSGIFK